MISFGKQSGKSESVSRPVQQSAWNDEQKLIAENLSGKILSGLEAPVSRYPKQMYVARTPEEEAYFQLASGQTPDWMKGRQGALDTVLSGRPSTDINEQYTQDYYKQAIEDPMRYQMANQLIPDIRATYAGPGYYGTARMDAERKARTDMEIELARQRANLFYADEQARRGLMESAANRQAAYALPAYEAEANRVATAGQLARQIEEQQVQSDMMRWFTGESMVDPETGKEVRPVQYNPFLKMAFEYLNYNPFVYGTESKATSKNEGFNFGITGPRVTNVTA